ncbi:hypothetical protein [Metamycoplasma hominis]|uniref:hypothetical protein n=1 Tax=Metamycoplasma hominis TaxID=2098 RepID=UPI001E350BF4|nr:hypothetical protein [Metamycoplasma hominis]
MGKLTYKIKLKTKKSLLKEYSKNPIESTKSRTFEFNGFAKDISEITKNLESIKNSNEFKNIKKMLN